MPLSPVVGDFTIYLWPETKTTIEILQTLGLKIGSLWAINSLLLALATSSPDLEERGHPAYTLE